MIQINQTKCTICGTCAEICPVRAITSDDVGVYIDESCCISCWTCATVCPQAALETERCQLKEKKYADHQGILVWAECEDNDGHLMPRRIAYELLSKGRHLADKLGQPLVAVVIGDSRLSRLDELCFQGADEVVRCCHELLGSYSTDGYTTALATIVAVKKPAIILFGATANGRDLAPRVAARLRFGLTADCTDLEVDENGRLLPSKPAFGGNIMATITSDSVPQAATIRENIFKIEKQDYNRKKVVSDIVVPLKKEMIRTRILKKISAGTIEKKVENERVCISVGLGCNEASLLELIREFTNRLRGTLVGTRPLVELGILSEDQLIGQSGVTVKPDLYFALGISGAIQHVVGMSGSKKIIAINRDPNAAIFNYAHLGVVGDVKEIVPMIIEELKR